MLAELPSRAEREPVVGAGLGGDETTAIDEAAERVVVERLQATRRDLHARLRGARASAVGDGGSTWVVVDPIDGSLNAKRGIPFFSLSVAVADGPTMGDVFFGYVYDFGSGEEWTAVRGEGARLNGAPLGGAAEGPDRDPVLRGDDDLVRSPSRPRRSSASRYRLRIMGSLALSLCHLAAGRVDGVCSLKPARSVDIAAAQLLVREQGLAIDLFEAPPFEAAPLDVGGAFARRRRGNARAVPEDRRRAVRIGCSGWNYRSWKDEFYGGLPARRWLEHYARHFDTVEVNNTFYRLPLRDVRSRAGWRRRRRAS